VSTIVPLYSAGGWLEREVWDLFGIFFFNNTDLRRILTDYGFVGYPLRKDFPLTGFIEIVYDDTEKQVVYKPLDLAQDFRNYRFKNVWKV
jgi:NADH-quinone oxidoreductase subunit C